MTFVDTSVLLPFLDRAADRHEEVVAALASVLAERRGITHNYVVVEAEALVMRRLGGAVARRLVHDVLPLIEIAWITPEIHARAVEAHLADLRRRTSLVDHASFVLMRERGIEDALALDRHFREAGFRVSP